MDQTPNDRAYLSILAWPELGDEDARIEMLVRAIGLDPYNARLAVRRGAPQVVCLIDVAVAREIVGALRSMGIDAVAPAREQMAALPDAQRARRVGRPRSDPGRIALSLHPSGSVIFDPGDVTAVLRASIATVKTSLETRSGADEMSMGAAMIGGAPGALAASMADAGPRRKTDFKVLELVEVQLADGRRFRLDQRGSIDDRAERFKPARDRMDELALTLGEACPGAWVDQRFREFHCPPDVLRTASKVTGSKIVRTRDDGPLFDFYSAWTMLMLRESAS